MRDMTQDSTRAAAAMTPMIHRSFEMSCAHMPSASESEVPFGVLLAEITRRTQLCMHSGPASKCVGETFGNGSKLNEYTSPCQASWHRDRAVGGVVCPT